MRYQQQYEPYQKVNAEYWKLKKAEDKNGKPLGFLKKSQAEEYKRKHQTELNTYKIYRDTLKSMIVEPDKKSNPKAWTKELDGLKESYRKTERPFSEAIVELAKMVPALLLYLKALSGAQSERQHMSPICILRSKGRPLLKN